jgi:hypothetical protein
MHRDKLGKCANYTFLYSTNALGSLKLDLPPRRHHLLLDRGLGNDGKELCIHIIMSNPDRLAIPKLAYFSTLWKSYCFI